MLYSSSRTALFVIELFKKLSYFPSDAASGGWLQGCIFCHGNCRKKQLHRGAPKNAPLLPPQACIYIMCSYGLGRKPISTLCKAATACLPSHSAHFLCCCKQLSSVSLFLPPCIVTFQAGRFGHSWTPPSSATTHSHALKQSLLRRLSF